MTSAPTTDISADNSHVLTGSRRPAARGYLIWAGLAVPWGVLITYLALSGAFVPKPGAMPGLIAVSIILPVIFVFGLVKILPSARRWVSILDASELTAFQGWRVMGGVFVALWWFDQLPITFSLFAGLGDVAVGLAAPFVAGKLYRAERGASKAARWLIVMGLLDFVVAVSVGGLSAPGLPLATKTGPTVLATMQFPLVLIPAFIVPNFAILHLLTWLRLQKQ